MIVLFIYHKVTGSYSAESGNRDESSSCSSNLLKVSIESNLSFEAGFTLFYANSHLYESVHLLISSYAHANRELSSTSEHDILVQPIAFKNLPFTEYLKELNFFSPRPNSPFAWC